jgi:hypothetical protein
VDRFSILSHVRGRLTEAHNAYARFSQAWAVCLVCIGCFSVGHAAKRESHRAQAGGQDQRLCIPGIECECRYLANDHTLSILFLHRLIDRQNTNVRQDGLGVINVAGRGFLGANENNIDSIVRQNEAPAPVSGEMGVEMARIPAGKTAARYPPLPLMSLSSRIGSPVPNGARAIDPAICSIPFGRCFLTMKLADAVAALAKSASAMFVVKPLARFRYRCRRPAPHRLDRGHRRRGGSGRRLVGFYEVRGNSAGGKGNTKDEDTRGFHWESLSR